MRARSPSIHSSERARLDRTSLSRWYVVMIEAIEFAESYELVLVVVGLGVLGIAGVLRSLERVWIPYPAIPLLLGLGAFSLPLDWPTIGPLDQPTISVHLTELGVLISLMGVGLKIDRLPSWRTWNSVWRLLGVAMPLTIAAMALLGGVVLGLPLAAAVLLGAVIAPTDPVLAADIQVGEPLEASGGVTPEAEDEVPFGLTAEAGLNDSLAFPFTYLAIFLSIDGVSPSSWIGEWLLIDVGYRIIVGVAAGVFGGWALARLLMAGSRRSELDRALTGIGALAATLLLYGVTESVGGYGFLAVFLGAVTIRHYESEHEAHASLHVYAEQAEQLLLTIILIAMGASIATGILGGLTWTAVAVAAIAVLVVRPLAGAAALAGSERLQGRDRSIVSFYGVRGIGSLYYMAYALENGSFGEHDELLWALTVAVIIFSIIIHGATAQAALATRATADQRVRPPA